jgi:mycothiol synthase
MFITQCPYTSNADKTQMLALSCQFPAENLRVTDLPYRLSSWALDDPENVALWFNEHQQLMAWAVLQTPFWTIDYAYHPTAADVHPQILAWADGRARAALGTEYGHPCWFVTAFSGQAERLRELEQAGFKCQADVGEDSWSKVFMRRPGEMPVKVYKPPQGYIVRPLTGEKEVEAYVELHQSVFESKNMTVDWRRRTLQHPAYTPELDLVVEAPDGRLVAFCICWLNKAVEAGPIGQVEPLGCRQEFGHLALGRVALSEGLRHLQALGAKNIFVETDSYRNIAFRLYESFDFQVIQDVLIYRKDYGDGQN